MKNKKLNTTQIILIVGFICIIALICVFGFFLLNANKENDTAPASGGNLVIDESNLEQVMSQMESSVEEGMFEVNMNTIWTFPNGESASADAYIANGHANKLPISFEIIVDEEIVYTSTVIPVGSQIKDIILDKPLDAGSYNAVCMYYLWNEDGTENSNFGVNIQLVVKE